MCPTESCGQKKLDFLGHDTLHYHVIYRTTTGRPKCYRCLLRQYRSYEKDIQIHKTGEKFSEPPAPILVRHRVIDFFLFGSFSEFINSTKKKPTSIILVLHKIVLLRKRWKHISRGVSSTPSAVLSWEGVPYP